MDKERQFYTFRGYTLHDAQRQKAMSASMEDYLEMVYRLSRDDSYTRVLELAAALHVQPPSASRMIRRLAQEGLVKYERYGIIRLTDEGRTIAESLLHRHNLLERFLRFIGLSEVLEDAERIEHNISNEAVGGMARLLDFFAGGLERFGVRADAPLAHRRRQRRRGGGRRGRGHGSPGKRQPVPPEAICSELQQRLEGAPSMFGSGLVPSTAAVRASED